MGDTVVGGPGQHTVNGHFHQGEARAFLKPAGGSFALDQRASARLSFRRGRKAAGTVSVAAHPGANRVRFEGRISRRKRLKPGRYSVAIVATNDAGQRAVGRTLRSASCAENGRIT
ncbi:MAG TPA: hypothetical protein VH231_03035 [Solirubrobacteraceae bacterium]|nr:hypothetical protein [Solirubrobacteraceae bacterium]